MNESEKIFIEDAESRGYVVLRSGWPDFALMKEDGSLFCVEVKTNTDLLSKKQAKMIYFLRRGGIPCFVSKNGEFPDLKIENGLFRAYGYRCDKCGIEPKELERKLLGDIEKEYLFRLNHVEENLRQIRKLCDE